jgi:hypothetical protein
MAALLFFCVQSKEFGLGKITGPWRIAGLGFMAASAPSHYHPTVQARVTDDGLTVCAMAALAFMISDVLHEGLGHACLALLTVAPSGLLTTVAWSSAYDSKLVAAGGTIVNLISAAVFWILLVTLRSASTRARLFLLLCCAFNLFTGTGYFLFSGITNFGDWEAVIQDLHPYWLWRVGLVLVGVLSYWGAVVVIGSGLVSYVGVAVAERSRYWKLAILSYCSAIVISVLGGLMNPLGFKYVLLSAIPATAGADCGLLWMRYYVLKSLMPTRHAEHIHRSWIWIGISVGVGIAFVFVLGRGIPLSR